MDIVQVTEVMGNVGEFVGAFAVLATLLYLALQVKYGREQLERNEKIMLSQVYQSRAVLRLTVLNQQVHLSDTLAKSRGGERILLPGEKLPAFDELDASEQVRVFGYYQQMAQTLDNSVYQHSLGLLPEQTIEQVRRTIKSVYPIWQQLGMPLPPAIAALSEQEDLT